MDQYSQPANSGGNPYDFILNPEQPKRQKGFRPGKSNFAMTIALIVGGAIIFMIILTLIINALAPKKISKDELVGLAQSQTELIRVSTEGTRSSVQQSTKDLATTIEYSLLTQRKRMITLLSSNGVKIGEKELALKQNAETDQKLTSAKSTSTFDSVFTQIIEDELNGYAAALKQLSTQATSAQERDLVSDYYQQTQLLISQIPYTQEKIDSAGQ